MANNLSKETLLALRDIDPAILAMLKEKLRDRMELLVFSQTNDFASIQGRAQELSELITAIETAGERLKKIISTENKK